MTREEFNNLKKGDLVVYVGNKANPRAGIDPTVLRLNGLVLEVDGFKEIKNQYGCAYRKLRLVQPFVESDFEVYIGGCGTLQFANTR